MANSEQNHIYAYNQSNRIQTERRSRYFRSLWCSFFMRRRTGSRREKEVVANTFVDIHEPKLAFLFFLTLFLCVTDAFLTLHIIDRGGEEINPFMDFLMKKDEMLFFWVKLAMTAFGMVFLILHKNFTFYRVINGYHFFYVIAAVYIVLVNYEIVLITQIIPNA